MDKPLQITFHNLPHSDALEEDVRGRVAKLEELFDRITGARVVIDSPHRNQAKGKTYAVRIEIALPGRELVVSREPVADLQRAMTAAFETVKRRLRGHAERSRGG
jgi:ribosome-associated translation inhibitor RaiA